MGYTQGGAKVRPVTTVSQKLQKPLLTCLFIEIYCRVSQEQNVFKNRSAFGNRGYSDSIIQHLFWLRVSVFLRHHV